MKPDDKSISNVDFVKRAFQLLDDPMLMPDRHVNTMEIAYRACNRLLDAEKEIARLKSLVMESFANGAKIGHEIGQMKADDGD